MIKTGASLKMKNLSRFWELVFMLLFLSVKLSLFAQTPVPSPSDNIYQMKEVVVYGEKNENEIIKGQDLGSLESDGRLGSLLDRVSSVESQGLGGAKSFSNISIRGAASNQTLILLNGQRVNQGFDLGMIPTGDIDRIEIIKGPDALIYGTDATGGVVNVFTHAQNKEPALEVLAGTFGTYQFQGSTGTLNLSTWKGSFGGNWYQTSGYTANTDETSWELDHSSSFRLGLDRMDLNANYVEKNGGAPNGDSLSAQDTGQFDADDREKKQALTASLSDKRPLGNWTLNPSFSYDYANVLRLNPLGPDASAGVPIQDQNIYNTFDFLATASAHWESLLSALSAGMEFRSQNIQDTEGLGGGNRADNLLSLFTNGNLALTPSLSLELNARLDSYNDYGISVFNPGGSLRFEAGPSKFLYLKAGTGFRYPGFDELYHPDITYILGPNTPVEFGAGEAGNPALKPESSMNSECGAQCGWKNLTWKADIFASFYKNLIIPAQNAATFWTFENIPNSRLIGIETSFNWEINSWLSPYGSYTYIDSLDTDRDQLIPARLRQKLNGGFRINPKNGMALTLYEQFADHNPAVYLGRQDSPPLIVASSYWILSAEFNWEIQKTLKIFLNGTNLLNQAYATIQGLPMPGRYLETGASIQF